MSEAYEATLARIRGWRPSGTLTDWLHYVNQLETKLAETLVDNEELAKHAADLEAELEEMIANTHADADTSPPLGPPQD